MTEAQSNRFAGLIFDIAKPKVEVEVEVEVEAVQKPLARTLEGERRFIPAGRALASENATRIQEVGEDLPIVPELGDVRTIQLVRKAIHVMRGGQALGWDKRELDNALAVFDRALAALLERMTG